MEAVTRCASRIQSLHVEHSVNGVSMPNPPDLYFARSHQLHLRGPTPSAIFHTISHRGYGVTIPMGPYNIQTPFLTPNGFPTFGSYFFYVAQSILMPFLKAHPALETVGLANVALANRILSRKNTKSRTPPARAR